jgi:methionyl-tRNA formyltransferase
MRVVLLTGNDLVGGAEHRYVTKVLRESLGEALVGVIVSNQPQKPLGQKLKRAWRRYDVAAMRRRVARAAFQSVTQAADKRAARCAKLLFSGDDPGTLITNRTYIVPDHNGVDCLALLDEMRPDVIAVYGTRVIKPAVMAKAQLDTLNLHTGLSPYYRGDSTIFWPLYFGDVDQIGVTVHRLAPELDGGDIIATAVTPYVVGDGEAELFAKAVRQGAELYAEAIKNVCAGTAQFSAQPDGVGREFRNVERTVAAELRVWWHCRRGLSPAHTKLYRRPVTSAQ